MDKGLVEATYTPAALEAVKHFPVEAERVELIEHSENLTYRVAVRGGETDHVLRLHRPDYNSIEELDSERLWTHALKQAGLTVPDSLTSRRGRHFERIDIPAAGEQRYAGMTTWFDGEPLRKHLDACTEADERKRLFRRIGSIAAAIHNQSANWKAPPGFARHSLDLEGLLGEQPYWGRFWDHPELTRTEKRLLLRAREQARAALCAYGATANNFGLIHADVHPDNIVHTGDDLALIDFDDSAYGWHLYDIATALIEDRPAADFEALRAALLEGYRERRPLTDRDLEMLDIFLTIRGMAIIGWFHQRPEHSGASFFREIKAMVLGDLQKAGTGPRRAR